MKRPWSSSQGSYTEVVETINSIANVMKVISEGASGGGGFHSGFLRTQEAQWRFLWGHNEEDRALGCLPPTPNLTRAAAFTSFTDWVLLKALFTEKILFLKMKNM